MGIGVAVLCLLATAVLFLFPSRTSVISDITISGEGITHNVTTIKTHIAPAISFNLSNELATTQKLVLQMKGIQLSNMIGEGDISVSGACGGNPKFTLVSPSENSLTISITGITCKTTAAGIISIPPGKIISSNTAGNYPVKISTASENGLVHLYVGSVK